MANVTFHLDADTAKAVQGFINVVDAQRKAERKLGDVSKKIKAQGSAFEGFASKASKALGALAIPASVFTVLEKYKTEIDAVIARTDQLAKGRMVNISVSDDPKVTRKQVESFAKAAAVTQEEAQGTVFQIRSAFSDKDKDTAVQAIAKAAPFVNDPVRLAGGIAKWKNNFSGEGSSIEQIQAGLVVAAGKSETETSDFGGEYAKIASSVKAVGGRSQFGAAALAYGSQMKGSTSMAADRIKALTTDMQKLDIPGATLEEKFLNMQKKGITTKNYLSKATGSTEAQEGFGIFESGYKNIVSDAAAVKAGMSAAGTPLGPVALMQQKLKNDPQTYLSFLKKQGNIGAEIGLEKSPEVLQGQAIEAAIAQAKMALAEQGVYNIGNKMKLDVVKAGARRMFGAVTPGSVGAVAYRLGSGERQVSEPQLGKGMGFASNEKVEVVIPDELKQTLESIDQALQTRTLTVTNNTNSTYTNADTE
jgi:hypothetical protein